MKRPFKMKQKAFFIILKFSSPLKQIHFKLGCTAWAWLNPDPVMYIFFEKGTKNGLS